jgi:hypothetical protein
MSLDVYLSTSGPSGKKSEARIFMREDGQTTELSREEWNARFPGQEPVTVDLGETNELFWRNITHNLSPMAQAAGIRDSLWCPDEIGITHAGQLIEPLTEGLARLKADPEKFKAHNPPNGWGDYAGLVAFVEAYLGACKEHPYADVRASR